MQLELLNGNGVIHQRSVVLHHPGRLICAAFTCLLCSSAWGLSFSEALSLARSNDPTFNIAQYSLVAAQERKEQAFASMLPQLSASANYSRNQRNYDVLESTPSDQEKEYYKSTGTQVNLTLPLLRPANLITLNQADITTMQAGYQLAAANQDLLGRLTHAWFELMQARDTLNFTEHQLAAEKHNWEQAKRANTLGLLAGPAVAEARAKYDQATAEHISAETEQNLKLSALEQIIGPQPSMNQAVLSMNFAVTSLAETLEYWLNHANTGNPTINAMMMATEAASKEVEKQRNLHLPTVDLVGSYGRNTQTAGNFPGQNGYAILLGTVGIQINAPIYAGGGQNAKVREALALHAKSKQELESARLSTRAAIKQAWFTWQSSFARYHAASQTIKFAQQSLDAAISGKHKGVKTERDVLQARQYYYGAYRDLNRARYDAIVNQLKLKAAAGQLTDDDLIRLDAWLENAPEDPANKHPDSPDQIDDNEMTAPDQVQLSGKLPSLASMNSGQAMTDKE